MYDEHISVDTSPWQRSLFAVGPAEPDPGFTTACRVPMADEAWVDYVPRWLAGADSLFETLLTTLEWQGHDRWMYERKVAEPRLRARLDGNPAARSVVGEMGVLLSRRYDVGFKSIGCNLYRSGRDSVAWHGDRVARDLPEATICVVSLGGDRRFLLRPKGGGRSVRFDLGSGDLLVMGGSCQRTWDHCVPKSAVAAPRISITYRHDYD